MPFKSLNVYDSAYLPAQRPPLTPCVSVRFLSLGLCLFLDLRLDYSLIHWDHDRAFVFLSSRNYGLPFHTFDPIV